MLTEDNPEIVCRAYAIIDEQSNASMITPNLADTLEVDAPKKSTSFQRVAAPERRNTVARCQD